MEQEDTNILEIKVSIINKHIMSQKQLKLWTHGSFLCHHRNSNIKKESFGNLNKSPKNIYICMRGQKFRSIHSCKQAGLMSCSTSPAIAPPHLRHLSWVFQMLETTTKWKELATWWSWAHGPQIYWCLRIDEVSHPVTSPWTNQKMCTRHSHTLLHLAFGNALLKHGRTQRLPYWVSQTKKEKYGMVSKTCGI